jgi:para-aminobenzoate synthetase/4-amino-4-deoxychorismate lyase
LLYARCERLSRDEADAWLAQQDGGGPPSIAGVAHVAKSVSRDAFDAAIAAGTTRCARAIRTRSTTRIG